MAIHMGPGPIREIRLGARRAVEIRHGAQSVWGAIALVMALQLAASGSLTLAARVGIVAQTALAGAGALTVAGSKPGVAAQAALTGTGTLAATPVPEPQLVDYGMSMAGMEMGHRADALPGTFGRDYSLNPIQWFEYAHAQGITHFRIPFLAERAEIRLGEIMDHVDQVLAVAPDVTVTIDMHNYGEKFVNGQRHQLGTEWTDAQFAAEWVAIGSHPVVANNPRVSFDIMNEAEGYTGYANDRAAAIALEGSHQAAVDALRGAGITNVLKFQPYSWGSARWVGDRHPTWWIDDPLNRSIISGHFYFDYSGAFVKTYDELDAESRAGGHASLPAQVRSELGTFVTWVNNQPDLPAAEIGEIGWPPTSAFNAVGDASLDQLAASTKPIGWTYWGMNHWWDFGVDDMMPFDFAGPGTPITANKAQMDVLDVQLDQKTPKTVTATAPTFGDTDYTIPAAFGVAYTVAGAVKQPGTYQASGQVVVTAAAKSAEFVLSGTTSWTGQLVEATVTTNYAINPRVVESGGSPTYVNVAWGGTTKQWLTGQTGWAHGTTTALAGTATNANTSWGNYVGVSDWSTSALDAIPEGTPVEMTVQGMRSGGGVLWVAVSWLNASGQDIKEDIGPDVNAAPGEKVTMTHTSTKPAGAARFHLQMRAPSAKAGEQFAATNFAFGTAEFFDGNTPDTATDDYAWVGTANASRSTRTST